MQINKVVKIFAGVMVLLAIASGIYLIVTSNKKKPSAITQNTEGLKPQSSLNTASEIKAPSASTVKKRQSEVLPVKKKVKESVPASTTTVKPTTNTQTGSLTGLNLAKAQWEQCKAKTVSNKTSFFWNMKISETIPFGGTYAKGFLNGDVNMPVQIYIKSGIANADQIKQKLVVGKSAIFKGNCLGVASEAVMFQVF